MLLVWANSISLFYLIYHFENYWRKNCSPCSVKRMLVNIKAIHIKITIIIDNFYSRIKTIFHSNFTSRKWWRNRFNYLSNKCVSVSSASEKGRNFVVFLTIVSCTLGLPYKTLDIVPTVQIVSYSLFRHFFLLAYFLS